MTNKLLRAHHKKRIETVIYKGKKYRLNVYESCDGLFELLGDIKKGAIRKLIAIKSTTFPNLSRPWWTEDAIETVDRLLTKDMLVFEWGRGGSTVWLAKRVRYLWSVEHSERWYEKMKKLCDKEKSLNVILWYKLDDPRYLGLTLDYILAFDFIFIDGRRRVECFKRAAKKIKPHGYILLDDAQREEYRPIFDIGGFEVVFRSRPNIMGKQTVIFRKMKEI